MAAVLFTCAGQRVDIVGAFRRAGALTVAADVNPLAPALYHADVQALVPRIDDDEYVRREAEIMKRLREVREWRERFGMSTSGGPVRVAESGESK